MLGVVAAVLFLIALVADLAKLALGPLDVTAFIAAGLLALALHLCGVGAGSGTRSSWRIRR